MAAYTITVLTADVERAGTNSNVFITLSGTKGESGEHRLESTRRNFERNSRDVFRLTLEDLGDLTHVRIRHDNSGLASGWLLEGIRIRNEDSGEEWIAACGRWLALDEDDRQIERTLNAVNLKQLAPGSAAGGGQEDQGVSS